MRAVVAVFALLLAPQPARSQPARPARAARAVVSVESQQERRALGVVLAGTGRILTSLEALRGAGELSVVYPDGRRDRARLVAVDAPWGVALLEGEAGTWPEGLTLATRDARTRDPVVWFSAPDAPPSRGTFARRRSFVGAGATLLRDAWELDPVPAATAVGGALSHPDDGTVLGLVLPPGRNDITGAEFPFGAPLSVLRLLIERAGESSRPWVGITFAEVLGGHAEVAAPGGGLRVRAVDPDGPGARAGLRGGANGDLVVAVDGRPVHSISAFGELVAPLRAGDTITLQVLRRGAVTDVPITLAPRPREPDAAPPTPPRATAPATPRRAPRRP
ncbi:MAG: S1C family serine protease [Polyangiales bacterium]